MISEVMISRLDELIGDYDTPFFNYILYSYDLSLRECEIIVDKLKEDISSGKIIPDNIVAVLDDYFKSRVITLEKQDKIKYLYGLIEEGCEFYIKYLKKYNLSRDEINLVFNRVKDKIIDENITDFEIKRYLKYYFSNTIKQTKYIDELTSIVGRNYDTLRIANAKKKYPILNDSDIVDIVFNIRGEIIEAKEFKNGIVHEFKRQCMLKSEDKKAKCRENLNKFVEGSGDSFSKLIKVKKLTRKDGEIIVAAILEDISRGMIQPEEINGAFITKRFNDYNERK